MDASVAVDAALNVALALLFGLPLFALAGVDADGRAALLSPVRRVCLFAAAAALLLSGVGLLLHAAAMAGVPPTAVDVGTLRAVLAMPGLGAAWLARAAALAAIVVVVTAAPLGRPALAALALLGGAALATLAWGGHLASGDGGDGSARLLAGLLHLLAAGAWVGALAGFLLLRRAARRSGRIETLRRALAAFARTGTAAVSVLAASGLAVAWLIVTNEGVGLGALAATAYGLLLGVKLLLFAAMLALAAVNRFRLTPTLVAGERRRDATLARLRLSLAAETALGTAVLGAAAWLSVLSPSG